MQILFLGSGSAHTTSTDNFQSNMILTAASGRRMLIDCGSDIRWSLARQKLSHQDITDIYISHLHADHIGGLEYIAFQTKFDPRCGRPRLYMEPALAERLWQRSLRGGLGLITEGETSLDSYFELCPIAPHESFVWEDARITAVPTLHVSCTTAAMHSNALLMEHAGRTTFLTTDTQFGPDRLGAYYEQADLIFHDCEIGPVRTGIHPHYEDLVRLPLSVRRKVWLYGYQPLPLPDAASDGFRGFVRRGQAFRLSGLPRRAPPAPKSGRKQAVA